MSEIMEAEGKLMEETPVPFHQRSSVRLVAIMLVCILLGLVLGRRL